jgi:hypothetical protein
MIAFTAFAVLALSGAAFTKKAASAPGLTPSPASKSFAQSYYWYSAFDGSYNDYETLSWEEWEMEVDYDCLVNTDPAGGTLVEEGYWFENPDYPASYLLYAHF